MTSPTPTVGYIVFAVGWLMGILVLWGFPYNPRQFDSFWRVIFSLFPWTLLTKGLVDLDLVAIDGEGGMGWADR